MLYAYTFGNHDIELDLNPIELGKLDMTHPYSLFNVTNGEEIDPDGYSNYYLQIESSYEEGKTRTLLWFLDTHNLKCEGRQNSNYGCINRKQ